MELSIFGKQLLGHTSSLFPITYYLVSAPLRLCVKILSITLANTINKIAIHPNFTISQSHNLAISQSHNLTISAGFLPSRL